MPQKLVRARIREDRRVLELPEPIPGAVGGEVYVALVGLPEEPPTDRTASRRRVTVWEDMRLRGPFPLTRREIYEDV
ncbi:MAG: hypothetical protein AABZ30_11945 [Myxococcota bacterium]